MLCLVVSLIKLFYITLRLCCSAAGLPEDMELTLNQNNADAVHVSTELNMGDDGKT